MPLMGTSMNTTLVSVLVFVPPLPTAAPQTTRTKERKMAQGDFTKEEATETEKAVDELFKGLPKTKQMQFLGHLNDILLFLNAAKQAAPAE